VRSHKARYLYLGIKACRRGSVVISLAGTIKKMYQNQFEVLVTPENRKLIEQVNRGVELDNYVSLHWKEITHIKKLLRAATRTELAVVLDELLEIQASS